MKMTQTLAVMASLMTGVGIATAGSITGTVTLKGTPPKEAENAQIMADAVCSKMHTTTPTTHHYVVGGKGELANVVVMLKGVPAKAADASKAAAVLDQKNCEYVPTILAVQTGQKITIKNSDPVMHNVHPIPSPTSGNKERNDSQMAGAADLTMTFDKAEPFMKFMCNVHPWMFAWVFVVDHPYFAVTDKEGKFTIKDVPAGKYKIVALHRKAAPTGVEQEVEVKDGEAKVDYTLEAK